MDERHRAAVPPSPHEVSERNLGVQGSARVSPAATQGAGAAPQTQSRFSSVCLLISNNEAGVRGRTPRAREPQAPECEPH